MGAGLLNGEEVLIDKIIGTVVRGRYSRKDIGR